MPEDDTTEQQYVLYELESGDRELHGGPYAPMKAREVRQAMAQHVDRGSRDWQVPEDAVDVVTVPRSEYRQDRGDDADV